MKFDIWTFLFQIINFTILLFILKKILYKPIQEIMEKRRGLIEKTVEDAEVTKKEASEIIEKEKAIFYAEKRRYETELKDKAIDTVSIFASNLLKDISDEELHRCIYRKLLDELGQIASVEETYKKILENTKHTFPEIINHIKQEGRIGEKEMEKLKDSITTVRA